MHDHITDRLSEYRDGELRDAERAEIEAHLATCAECSAVLADIDVVAMSAASLGALKPPRDLWPGIAARIAAEPKQASGDDVIPITAAPRPPRRFSFTVPQLAAAAIVLALAAAGAARVLPQRGGGVAGPVAARADDATGSLQLVAQVEMSYEPTIRQLEELLGEAETLLDPETVAVLRQSLATIDTAIDEARTALEADPANVFLSRHLDGTLRRKVDLLRQANRLVART
jgi:hypothetical protein